MLVCHHVCNHSSFIVLVLLDADLVQIETEQLNYKWLQGYFPLCYHASIARLFDSFTFFCLGFVMLEKQIQQAHCCQCDTETGDNVLICRSACIGSHFNTLNYLFDLKKKIKRATKQRQNVATVGGVLEASRG